MAALPGCYLARASERGGRRPAHAAQEDPALTQLALARTVWVGQPTTADGSWTGSLSSMAKGETTMQPRIAPMVDEALLAAGVQRA